MRIPRFLQPYRLALTLMVVAAYGLFAACGVTSTGDTAPRTDSAATATAVATGVAGVRGTVHPLPSASISTVTPSTSPVSGATTGAVRLVLDQPSYSPGSSAMVTIENGLGVTIAVTNNHTSCTYVQLEQFASGAWQPVGQCTGLTPIVLTKLAPGSVTQQKIGIPEGSGAAGTYRVALTYNDSNAYSATFTVA